MLEESGDLTFDRIITPAAVENALRVLLAISGSTNAVVHLAASVGRLGFALDMDLLNRPSDAQPVLVDLKQTGAHYREAQHAPCGSPAVLTARGDSLNAAVAHATGQT